VFKTFFSQASIATAFLFAGLATTDSQETSLNEVEGKWRVTRDLKNGGRDVSTLDLKRNGSEVSGTFTDSNGEIATIQDGRLVDESLTFSFDYANRHLDVSGEILSVRRIDLTITTRGKSESFHAIAERK
jgi:hypothetical protein